MNDAENLRLAKERTFLAAERTLFSAQSTLSSWIRTGLASVGGGFAIIRLIAFQPISHRIMAKIIGELLIIWGIIILISSLCSYRKFCKNIKNDLPPTTEPWITSTVVIFVVVSLFLVFVTINQ